MNHVPLMRLRDLRDHLKAEGSVPCTDETVRDLSEVIEMLEKASSPAGSSSDCPSCGADRGSSHGLLCSAVGNDRIHEEMVRLTTDLQNQVSTMKRDVSALEGEENEQGRTPREQVIEDARFNREWLENLEAWRESQRIYPTTTEGVARAFEEFRTIVYEDRGLLDRINELEKRVGTQWEDELPPPTCSPGEETGVIGTAGATPPPEDGDCPECGGSGSMNNGSRGVGGCPCTPEDGGGEWTVDERAEVDAWLFKHLSNDTEFPGPAAAAVVRVARDHGTPRLRAALLAEARKAGPDDDKLYKKTRFA